MSRSDQHENLLVSYAMKENWSYERTKTALDIARNPYRYGQDEHPFAYFSDNDVYK